MTSDLSVDFNSFIVSLASSAMVHLGENSDPNLKGAGKDLLLARNTIDVLGLLHEKTKGNLDDQEKALLESVLYELRLKFVAIQREESTG